uniref:FTH domain-containing protein n=1 Tax=Panagrellus redivivus TaxID=6233 RepID=A0A7E4VM46_PANRE
MSEEDLRLPLLKYPFGPMLKNLTSPIEYYRLKVACGQHAPQYLPNRPMTVHHADTMEIYSRHNAVRAKYLCNTVQYRSTPRGEHVIHLDGAHLELVDLRTEDFDKPLFNHIYLNESTVTLRRCRVDKLFLSKMAKDDFRQVSKIVDVDCAVNIDINIQVFLEQFPSIVDSTFKIRVSPGWVREMLDMDKREMNQFCVFGTFKEVFSFEWDEFTQFFERQDTVFKLHLIMPKPPKSYDIMDNFPYGDFMVSSKNNDGMKISYTGAEMYYGSVNIHYC